MPADPPKRPPIRRDAEANRERILAAAEAVFGAQGAVGSTEEVAGLAHVGIATVFRHFPTREALIEATLVRHFAHLNRHAEALAQGAEPVQALREILATMVRTGATKLTLASRITDTSEPPEAVSAAARALRDTIGRVLHRAQATGAVDAEVTIDELYLLIRALAQASATLPPDPTTLQRALEIVDRGLAPRR